MVRRPDQQTAIERRLLGPRGITRNRFDKEFQAAGHGTELLKYYSDGPGATNHAIPNALQINDAASVAMLQPLYVLIAFARHAGVDMPADAEVLIELVLDLADEEATDEERRGAFEICRAALAVIKRLGRS